MYNMQGSEKPRSLKTQTHYVFWVFWALLGFRFFYLNEQLGSLLVDLVHQLSFYLDSLVL